MKERGKRRELELVLWGGVGGVSGGGVGGVSDGMHARANIVKTVLNVNLLCAHYSK